MPVILPEWAPRSGESLQSYRQRVNLSGIDSNYDATRNVEVRPARPRSPTAMFRNLTTNNTQISGRVKGSTPAAIASITLRHVHSLLRQKQWVKASVKCTTLLDQGWSYFIRDSWVTQWGQNEQHPWRLIKAPSPNITRPQDLEDKEKVERDLWGSAVLRDHNGTDIMNLPAIGCLIALKVHTTGQPIDHKFDPLEELKNIYRTRWETRAAARRAVNTLYDPETVPPVPLSAGLLGQGVRAVMINMEHDADTLDSGVLDRYIGLV